jgi:hypothetical protein
MGQEMPYQRETSVMLQAMQNQQSGKNAMMMTPKDVLNAEEALRKEYNPQAKPIRNAIRAFNDTYTAIQQAGGDYNKLSGAGQIQMVKNWAKMILPDEAVMAGDTNAVAQAAQANLGGTIDSWLNFFKGKGELPEGMIGQIFDSMKQMALRNAQEGVDLNQYYSDLATGQIANPARVIREIPRLLMLQKQESASAAIPGSTTAQNGQPGAPSTTLPAPDLEFFGGKKRQNVPAFNFNL